MKHFTLTFLLLFSGLAPAISQSTQVLTVDAEIKEMIQDISADSIRLYVEKMVSFGTRHSLSDTISNTTGIGAARRWVADKMKSFALRHKANFTVVLDPFESIPGPRNPRIPYRVVMKNVVGTLQGSDPTDKRVLLISGHLDSRNTDVMDSIGLAPGANDDASGVALVLELARVMSKRSFPCTIIFMAVQGEEQGLLGAHHMASTMKKDGADLIAMFNNDIVGNSTASETGERKDNTVRLFSEMIPASETDDQTAARLALKSENDSPSRQLARYIKEVAEMYLNDFSVTLNARPDRFLRGGDHTPFNRLGFTAVRFCEFHENFNQQHQDVRTEGGVEYGDLVKFMDFPYAANVARVNLAGLASLAKAPGAPQQVFMTINLGNKTNLLWSPPSTGPKVKGYYVLLRETYQPFWEKRIFTENTSIEIPYSKDNYFFAVQSVGHDGHVSQMVMPAPRRN